MPARARHVLAVLALVVTLAGVGVAQTAAGVLRIGTSGDYRPFSVRDTNGAFSGFDIVVAQRLATDLGRRPEFVAFRWPDLMAQVRAGAFDVVMSGVTVRADRAVALLFTRPYAVTGAVAVIRTRRRQRFAHLADLDRAGVRIAVNGGGHLETVARRHFAHAEVVSVTDNTTLPGLVLRGEVDAAISEALEARRWPHQGLAMLGPFTRDRKAYALPEASADLLRQINDWLAAREADGWLNTQRRRWLGAATTWTVPQADFEALLAAMDLRLQLMPMVAAVKRRDRLPINDPAQEARVLEHVRTAAAAAQLNADDVARLFRVQMEAAKMVEHEAPTTTVAAGVSLTELRPAVARASDQVIEELARCQPWLSQPRGRRQLDAAVRDGLTAPGMTAALRSQLADAVRHVRCDVPSRN